MFHNFSAGGYHHHVGINTWNSLDGDIHTHGEVGLEYFTSNQASVLLTAPYPPFGLAAASFAGLSSYLVLVGIYSSAISVAEDSKLRQSIRSFAVKESRLLESIGIAEIEQQVQRKVIAFTKQNQDRMAEETGIQSSLSEDDIKQYLEQVIKEVKKPERPNNGNNV